MGIKRDRRELHIYIYICIFFILVNLILNGLIILNLIDNKIIEDLINVFGFLKVISIFIIVFGVFKDTEYNLEYSFKKIFKKNSYMFIFNIALLSYFLIINTLIDDKLINSSAFNALFFSILLTVLWFYDELLKTDRKTAWQKSCGTYKEYKNTFFWRCKVSFLDIEKSFTRKEILRLSNKGILSMYLIASVTVLILSKGINILVIVTLIKPVLFLLDITFTLASSIEGECTDYYIKSRGRSGGSSYYIYIITNYEKKKEVKFTSNEELLFCEGDCIKVYYTLLSKIILKYSLTS
ncbi:hypothetical protein [Clostridium sp. ZS2-4]|uniref:hypothetical protein n=1 Tax=Clostridium sp. ZS2-4 TaxID=2987703 RepID=UPI00227A36D8|nr:hypothetical protein [Clostridium sp. ZS2-4]MCY6356194.1 hypothetical protein [Clostridium sp. ZS2-4]